MRCHGRRVCAQTPGKALRGGCYPLKIPRVKPPASPGHVYGSAAPTGKTVQLHLNAPPPNLGQSNLTCTGHAHSVTSPPIQPFEKRKCLFPWRRFALVVLRIAVRTGSTHGAFVLERPSSAHFHTPSSLTFITLTLNDSRCFYSAFFIPLNC